MLNSSVLKCFDAERALMAAESDFSIKSNEDIPSSFVTCKLMTVAAVLIDW